MSKAAAVCTLDRVSYIPVDLKSVYVFKFEYIISRWSLLYNNTSLIELESMCQWKRNTKSEIKLRLGHL